MKRDFTQTPYDLNCPDPKDRLESLRACMRGVIGGRIDKPQKGIDVNNHIHTTFSFSPYSPT
ncbi:MAG: PHP domain-containing protein, partial [Bacillota bacterium]